MSLTVEVVQLDAAETAQLNRFEERIEQGLASFIEVGEALSAIRDRKLYRATHGTFEDYCRVKWGMSASRARQLCGASEVAASVTNVTLRTESQARELARVPAPQRQQVVEKAVATTGGKLTAAAIREASDAHVVEPTKPSRRRPTLFDFAEWQRNTRSRLGLILTGVPVRYRSQAAQFIIGLAQRFVSISTAPNALTPSAAALRAGEEAERDSEKLWRLKSLWNKTTKKDRAAFVAWCGREVSK